MRRAAIQRTRLRRLDRPRQGLDQGRKSAMQALPGDVLVVLEIRDQIRNPLHERKIHMVLALGFKKQRTERFIVCVHGF